MSGLTRRETPDRSKINIDDPVEVKSWSRELKVSREQLRGVVEKVGNAAAVRKELDHEKGNGTV